MYLPRTFQSEDSQCVKTPVIIMVYCTQQQQLKGKQLYFFKFVM